ncbi:uncharacterized protein LOC108160555 [Drosophila miranda]|uniref:uncharacterized protein LOC108160555 n=1 Tax=Drosophila miranda TaxID=7229 RepID=UPI00143F46F5|nr:uncharacterized protein LOC108160555 [Drosophila miranda]
MSNTSISPIPTLKGIFSVPRAGANQGRNFLKENKVSLRSLEKSTSEKLAAKEPVRPKWMPPMRRAGSEVRESKTGRPPVSRQNTQETSLQRNRNHSRSHHQLGVAVPDAGERFDGLESRNPMRDDPSVEAQKDFEQSPDRYSERCSSCRTQRSSTSIGIQTEDITDELYLTNALKKCSFDGDSMLDEHPNKYDNNYRRSSNRYDNNENEHLQPSRFNMNELNAMIPLPDVDLRTEVASDEEAPLSARSRFTVATISSNASTTSITSKRREHKLGSRDELRLPRYLEKEKREKAAAKELADARDPDCPRGHTLLSEEDRVGHLNSAKKRYDGLISELNHMPMTAQTLRVRNRKAEIDKELGIVDEEIRVYSKPKVYISSSKYQ